MKPISRRSFIQKCSTSGAGLVLSGAFLSGAPFIDLQSNKRPRITHGVASGDVDASRAVLWARSDRPARLVAEISSRPDFSRSQTIRGTLGSQGNDFNAHVFPSNLLPGTRYNYRLRFESIDQPGLYSRAETGCFTTAPDSRKTVRFLWSGDTAGQGFGINPDHGGMLTYAAMAARKPDFFVHCGDLIYADNPMSPEMTLRDGSTWKNQLVEAKTKVAEEINEFRENFYYNLEDAHVRHFLAETPVIQLWDDHEVVNNWYPGEILDDDRYRIKDVDTLAANARVAYFDCNPIRPHETDPERIYRKIAYGPLLDLFAIDLRSYRGANSLNRQPAQNAATDILGETQLDWLKRSLKESTATWKIVCSDMPIGLVIAEWGKEIYEAVANDEPGPPAGRELEFANLLEFIAREAIENVHFITADVHYCASHYYNPEKASFKNFKPFWEFVSGPLHAGTFGPNKLDGTFGPELVFKGIPDDLAPFTPPSAGFQFFGEMEIDGETENLTVRHFNREGNLLWEKTLEACSKTVR
jgi:alkaline phosphatase D